MDLCWNWFIIYAKPRCHENRADELPGTTNGFFGPLAAAGRILASIYATWFCDYTEDKRNWTMNHRGIGVAAIIVSAAIFTAAFSAGCFNASVDTRGWQSVAREYKDAYAPSDRDKQRAIQAARETAIEAGLAEKDLDRYDMDAAYRGESWWVEFRHEDRGGKSWPDRFVVRVDRDGKTTLFQDPAAAPGR
jgi:hypothetical protein